MTGNKGEWSEVYAFLKLLNDKRMYAGDENLNLISSIFYPILSIRRDSMLTYSIDDKTNIINLIDDGNIIDSIDLHTFSYFISELFKNIKNSTTTTFEIPSLSKFLESLQINKISSSSHNKQDVVIKFYDIKTSLVNESGFSIKSMLGNSSTLFNASGSTKFIYKINNCNSKVYNETKSLKPGKDTVSFLINNGCTLQYTKTSNNIFTSNLMMTDFMMPELVANILLIYYSSKNSTLTSIISIIEKNNFLNIPQDYISIFYKYKIKQLLVNIALGMMPATVWAGNYTANGGYIIIKETGEIICYHIYDKNRFENYLFTNIKFDTPSLSRHKCGYVYIDNNDYFIDLPLQLRFIR